MNEYSDWIRLNATPGVGCITACKLLAVFGLPQSIFQASYAELHAIVPDRIARAICTEPDHALHELIDKTALWCDQPGNTLLTLASTNYPPLLLEIPDPPILLYIKGNIKLLHNNAIAVVGSRNATAQGVTNAKQFALSLSQAGYTIISGMALGIDTAAHQGGLQGIGSTIAVIGTGADIVYPSRNHALAHQIAEQGCIVSEYPLGTPAIAANFPRRNRLISGLSRGVLVIEAAAQSGSLITARMAAEQGRDVFAIPGSIHSPLAKGFHELLRQCAQLVENVQDILLEMATTATIVAAGSTTPTTVSTTLSPEDTMVLDAMGFDPIHIDVLSQRCNIEISNMLSQLLLLELSGHVAIVAGGLYQRLVSHAD